MPLIRKDGYPDGRSLRTVRTRPACRRGKKRCGTCRKWKPLKNFFNRLGSHDGKGTRCKVCDRKARKKHYETNYDREKASATRLKSLYGLTKDQHRKMIEDQNGGCKICGSGDRLVVDHDHETQKVRGILCNSCNRGLGYFKDSPSVLRAAADYLESTF